MSSAPSSVNTGRGGRSQACYVLIAVRTTVARLFSMLSDRLGLPGEVPMPSLGVVACAVRRELMALLHADALVLCYWCPGRRGLHLMAASFSDFPEGPALYLSMAQPLGLTWVPKSPRVRAARADRHHSTSRSGPGHARDRRPARSRLPYTWSRVRIPAAAIPTAARRRC